jgi:hypothetical protein
MEKVFSVVSLVISGIALLVFLSFLFSWPVYILWNGSLIGAVDGIHEITWMQAWGINLLFGILFRSTVHQNNK